MLAGDCSSAIHFHQLCFGRIAEDGRDTRVSKAELPTPNTKKVRSKRVRRRGRAQNAVLGRARGVAELLWGVPQWQTCEKKHEIFMGFRGNTVTAITGNTFSGQEMLFWTFLTKNIFIDFPTPILKCIFVRFC